MGGGGTFTGAIDVEKIAAAANERIRNAFEAGGYVLFGANYSDMDELKDRITNTANLAGLKYEIAHEKLDNIDQIIEPASLVVIYSGSDDQNDWLTQLVSKALTHKKSTVGTKSINSGDGTPKFISQFRMRLLSWAELTDLLAA